MRVFTSSALLLLLALLTACSVTSHLNIEAGKQFVLGGQQRGAFRVAVHNTGPVPVSVGERLTDGTVREMGRLEPRQSTRLAFAAGSAALVRNLGQSGAELDVLITGIDASYKMGMGYEALKK